MAQATLDQLSRGVYPQLLADAGLAVALRAAWSTSPVPVDLVDETSGRFPVEVESAAYFCCLEAVQNAVKHARPTRVLVRLASRDAALWLEVEDDGTGFDPTGVIEGAGLANMRDRLEPLGGTLRLQSRPAGGTRLSSQIPLGSVSGGTSG
jgi:signal transduction histidine kinase